MKKKIVVLGCTGSIGTQTLEVAAELGYEVLGLSAGSNIDLLEKQVLEFKPEVVSVRDDKAAEELEKRLKSSATRVLSGEEGAIHVAEMDGADVVVSAIVGIAGLKPTLAAIRKGRTVALANKETLVAAGVLVTREAKESGAVIIPVDSEHSAIFQCLQGNRREQVEKLILTASGGPFRGMTRQELEKVTVEQALAHPNWNMGNKITIDSATLMNKGLEVIEARWLFDLPPEKIQVLVHPQSIVHSAVEYVDGSVIAQLALPDMRLPIQYALTWPDRLANSFSRLDLLRCSQLTFEEPDTDTFPCLRLAFEALAAGGTMPAVMNAANETAVELFLSRRNKFHHIPRIIDTVMSAHSPVENPDLEDIEKADSWARTQALKAAASLNR